MRSLDVVALAELRPTHLANSRNEAGTTCPARQRARRGGPRHRVGGLDGWSSEQLGREEW
jgi:hypothetical protein